MGLFLLSEAQMGRISPFFPLAHGVPRVDDRRVISGIVYVIKHGLQWKDAPERQRLMGALDALNGRYGRGTLVYAMAAGQRKGWKLRSEHLSPRFTTSWEGLLQV